MTKAVRSVVGNCMERIPPMRSACYTTEMSFYRVLIQLTDIKDSDPITEHMWFCEGIDSYEDDINWIIEGGIHVP